MTVNQQSASRLRWRCRRGIKEMDILLARFLDEIYPGLPEGDKYIFAAMLEEADLDIYAWITGQNLPENTGYHEIITRLQLMSETK